MTNLTPLTAEQIKRVKSEINQLIKKQEIELSYSPDFQHAWKVSMIEAQIMKLESMLVNGWEAPKFN